MPTDLPGWDAAVAALRQLEGRTVAVRIARPDHDDELVAVFHGRLGTLTDSAKQPSLFWPIGMPAPDHQEQPGIYLREHDFESAEMRAGDIVVIREAGVVVNVRPLELRTSTPRAGGNR